MQAIDEDAPGSGAVVVVFLPLLWVVVVVHVSNERERVHATAVECPRGTWTHRYCYFY